VNLKLVNKKDLNKILEDILLLNSKTRLKLSYVIGEDVLEVSAIVGIKPEYDYIRIPDLLGEGLLEVSRIEEAVPKGFVLDEKHKDYDSKENAKKSP